MKDIFDFYNDQDEDVRLSLDRAHGLEYITTMHYIDKISNSNSTILDACAGTGAYCFDLARKGHDVIAGDLVPSNVEIIVRNIWRMSIDDERKIKKSFNGRAITAFSQI